MCIKCGKLVNCEFKKYTKGEWIVVEEDESFDIEYRNEDGGGFIAELPKYANAKADAQRIVQCVNNFDDLLEACKAVDTAGAGGDIDMATAVDMCLLAIAKAESE